VLLGRRGTAQPTTAVAVWISDEKGISFQGFVELGETGAGPVGFFLSG
jgi:hypothetical protein